MRTFNDGLTRLLEGRDPSVVVDDLIANAHSATDNLFCDECSFSTDHGPAFLSHLAETHARWYEGMEELYSELDEASIKKISPAEHRRRSKSAKRSARNNKSNLKRAGRKGAKRHGHPLSKNRRKSRIRKLKAKRGKTSGYRVLI
jgi:hypothetical protein